MATERCGFLTSTSQCDSLVRDRSGIYFNAANSYICRLEKVDSLLRIAAFRIVFDATNMPHGQHTLVSKNITRYHGSCDLELK
jgi:hypothetical protein